MDVFLKHHGLFRASEADLDSLRYETNCYPLELAYFLEVRREGQCSQVDAGASRVDASRVDCWFLLSQLDCSTGVDLTRVDLTACASSRRGCASTRRACCVESTQSTRLGARGLDCVDSTIVHS